MSTVKPSLPVPAAIPATWPGVEADTRACGLIAKIIAGWDVPADREDIKLAGLSPRETGNFFFLLVSICHQTSPAGAPPLAGLVGHKRLKGWDYLAARLEQQVHLAPSLLAPHQWRLLTAERLEVLFRDERLGSRLTSTARRAQLINNLGETMKRHRWEWADDVFAAAGHRVATGKPNLFQLLSLFDAYSDPVRKKSCFFLSLMRNVGLWSYADEENLGPPVDYHEVRGHLRLGTVRVTDPEVRHKLLHREPVTIDEDLAIRGAVYDAIMRIARAGQKHTPSQLHYLFWNIFRSCCTREDPHCRTCSPDCDLPSRYLHLAVEGNARRCPFASVCASANLARKYYDHVFETDYY